jgi:histidyl-tRNA synthetase
MGVDRIFLASAIADPGTRLDAYVIVASEDKRTVARQLVSQLRNQGMRVDMTDVMRSVKAQFKEANRSAAAHAVIVGEEWQSGFVAVKNLSTGDQQDIPVKEIGQWLQA